MSTVWMLAIDIAEDAYLSQLLATSIAPLLRILHSLASRKWQVFSLTDKQDDRLSWSDAVEATSQDGTLLSGKFHAFLHIYGKHHHAVILAFLGFGIHLINTHSLAMTSKGSLINITYIIGGSQLVHHFSQSDRQGDRISSLIQIHERYRFTGDFIHRNLQMIQHLQASII